MSTTRSPFLRFGALAPWRCLFVVIVAMATFLTTHVASAADDFLEPGRAFQFEARALDARRVEVVFTVAPGYYLYREQFKFAAEGATLGTPVYPKGKVKFDETFQKSVETFRDVVRLVVPVEAVQGAQGGGRGEFRLVTTSQGCADAGLCYPPMQSVAIVALTGFGGDGTARTVGAADASPAALGSARLSAVNPSIEPIVRRSAVSAIAPSSNMASPIESVLRGGNFWLVVGAFFAAGILLSLTPCMLPMLPIISSIIVGQGEQVSRGRGLALAGAYSLGMAVVYTALGVAAGLAGEGLAAALQSPWVLGFFAFGLVLLSLSMFGLYTFRMPSSMTCRMADASNRLPAGKLAGVGAMGGVSALIVSPCVAAPLAGAMLYLSQSRDVWLGGTALFCLAIGMSVPLLLVGASAGALLPRAGAWMNDLKHLFGVLLLGVALWTVQTVLPASLVLALWGALALGSAVALLSPRGSVAVAALGAGAAADVVGGAVVVQPVARPIWRTAAAALLGLIGLLQLVGAASGGTDPLQPIAHLARSGGAVSLSGAAAGMPTFVAVRSTEELDAALRTAGRPVMLDFYADWCVSCKEMERFTFTDAGVKGQFAKALLLRADVTQNNDDDKALLKRFHLFGPPGTIFFDAHGDEIGAARVVGYQNAETFSATLRSAGL